MGKNKKKFQKKLQKQNDFLFKRLEMQNESIQYMIESLLENYSNNYMMMHLLVGKVSVSK